VGNMSKNIIDDLGLLFLSKVDSDYRFWTTIYL
jgi:hypothetical protein